MSQQNIHVQHTSLLALLVPACGVNYICGSMQLCYWYSTMNLYTLTCATCACMYMYMNGMPSVYTYMYMYI